MKIVPHYSSAMKSSRKIKAKKKKIFLHKVCECVPFWVFPQITLRKLQEFCGMNTYVAWTAWKHQLSMYLYIYLHLFPTSKRKKVSCYFNKQDKYAGLIQNKFSSCICSTMFSTVAAIHCLEF